MDPNEALRRVVDAAVTGQSVEMLKAARDLAIWLNKGGFPPMDPRGALALRVREGRSVRCGFYVGTDGPDDDTPQCPQAASDARYLGDELVPTCADHYRTGGFVGAKRATYMGEESAT